MFELYSASVAHAGKRSYEIVKNNLTAPEIVILRAIHGQDTVTKIKPTGKRSPKAIEKLPDSEKLEASELLTNAGELRRLRQLYKDFVVDDDKPIVDALWPGFNPQLPLTLEPQKELASELA